MAQEIFIGGSLYHEDGTDSLFMGGSLLNENEPAAVSSSSSSSSGLDVSYQTFPYLNKPTRISRAFQARNAQQAKYPTLWKDLAYWYEGPIHGVEPDPILWSGTTNYGSAGNHKLEYNGPLGVGHNLGRLRPQWRTDSNYRIRQSNQWTFVLFNKCIVQGVGDNYFYTNTGSTNASVYFRINANHIIDARAYTSLAIRAEVIGLTTINLNAWYKVIVSLDADNLDNNKVWLDGVDDTDTQVASGIDINADASRNWYWGIDAGSNGGGHITERFAIYQRILTAGERQLIFDEHAHPYELKDTKLFFMRQTPDAASSSSSSSSAVEAATSNIIVYNDSYIPFRHDLGFKATNANESRYPNLWKGLLFDTSYAELEQIKYAEPSPATDWADWKTTRVKGPFGSTLAYEKISDASDPIEWWGGESNYWPGSDEVSASGWIWLEELPNASGAFGEVAFPRKTSAWQVGLQHDGVNNNIACLVNTSSSTGWTAAAFHIYTVNIKRWIHLALTYRDGEGINTYYNGKLIGNYAATGTVVNNINNITFGGANSHKMKNGGRIGPAQVWNRKLEPQEIQQLCRGALPSHPKTLFFGGGLESSGSSSSSSSSVSGVEDTGANGIICLPKVPSRPLPIANMQDPLNKGLVFWWVGLPFFGGGQAFDVSLYNEHGTLNSMFPPNDWVASNTPGFSALDFDGINDYISISKGEQHKADEWTVSAWINPDNLPGSSDEMPIFAGADNSDGANDYTYYLALSNGVLGSGQGFWIFYENSSGGNIYVRHQKTLATGQWHHLVGVRGNGFLKLYLNGSEVTATTSGGDPNDLPDQHDEDITIGRRFSNVSTGTHFDGKIANVSLRNRPLNSSEVKELYEDSLNGYRKTLKHLPIYVHTSVAAAAGSITGTGDLDLLVITVDGSGNQIYNSTGALDLEVLEASGSGKQIYNSTGALDLLVLTIDGSGKQTYQATGNPTLEVLEVSGVGKQIYNSTGDLTLEILTIDGDGGIGTVGSGDLDLLVLEVDGSGSQTYNSSGALTLEILEASGVGLKTKLGTGALDLLVIEVSGSGTLAGAKTATGSLQLETLLASGVGEIPVILDSSVAEVLPPTIYAAIWQKLKDNL